MSINKHGTGTSSGVGMPVGPGVGATVASVVGPGVGGGVGLLVGPGDGLTVATTSHTILMHKIYSITHFTI